MSMVREGRQPVLLVVDVQAGVMQAAWQAQRVIANIVAVVDRARRQKVPVLWVQHADAQLPAGSPPWQWVPGLLPAEGEVVIHKAHNSAFERTPLEAELARLGATHIVLAGAQSNWCIRATAHAALERGYDLTLVSDAHSTESIALEGAAAIDAEQVVRELNIAITWLDYPGRRNTTASAAELDFHA